VQRTGLRPGLVARAPARLAVDGYDRIVGQYKSWQSKQRLLNSMKINETFNMTMLSKCDCPGHHPLSTWEGWLYLAVVIDLQTRQVLGYSVSERMPDDWVCQALLEARGSHCRLRDPDSSLPSDRLHYPRLLQPHANSS
jgi:transposase InsO family protein